MKSQKLRSLLIRKKVSQFGEAVAELASKLKDGYQEVKEKFGKNSPSPVEYYKRVREKFFKLLEKK